jgi:hypothetical protein
MSKYQLEANNPILTGRIAPAFVFAGVVHASQPRKSTTIPYMFHGARSLSRSAAISRSRPVTRDRDDLERISDEK